MTKSPAGWTCYVCAFVLVIVAVMCLVAHDPQDATAWGVVAIFFLLFSRDQ